MGSFRPGNEPAPLSALEGGVLTTGLPRNFPQITLGGVHTAHQVGILHALAHLARAPILADTAPSAPRKQKLRVELTSSPQGHPARMWQSQMGTRGALVRSQRGKARKASGTVPDAR